VRWLRNVSLFLLLNIVASLALAALPGQIDGQRLPSLAPMLENTAPAVVSVATYATVHRHSNPLLEDPFFRRFFNLPEGRGEQAHEARNAGSGVIVDAKHGYVLTNAHVVRGAERLEVQLANGKTLAAELVGTDEQVDLAVLKVPSEGLHEVRMGDSSTLRVGDFVVAIGNPFGLGQTVTSGIVSALGRTGLRLNGFENYIQTDASINPGNSGGALVDLEGNLVGINTAILAPSGGNIGIGFAIPTEMATLVMQQLIEYGEVRRGVLGVRVQDLSAELAQAFAIEHDQGVVISQVVRGSAADKAGAKPGDVVLEMDGKPVQRAADLHNRVGLLPVGEKITLKVMREGEVKQLQARIIANPEATTEGGKISRYLQGALLSETEKQGQGVLLREVQQGSPAWQAGLRRGDTIVAANQQNVRQLAALRQAVPSDGARLLLRVRRQGGTFFLVLG